MLDRVNQARAVGRTCGSTYYSAAAPLAWNGKLFDAAAGHAQDMAANNYFSHTSQDGRTFSQRITNAGYAWSAAAENIAAGQGTVAQVMDGWLQSPGHCANIMNGNYSEIGVACARNDASAYQQYWVMELGRPR
ncbi:CAP domain-containing protein [Ralstonia sp. RL]|uniref:CAP domain-containing protein n=1 Tax=Ralstonia sp. RL TaxID=1839756 RepID=UPI000AD7A0F8|nr:CAP domain-containing protein [Ralstonia sp. RL]